jgi:DNA-directed RNA polymerase subunit omega
MKEPSIDELMKVVDNKYSLVVMTAKRARAITEEINAVQENENQELIKPVTEALIQIANKEVDFFVPKFNSNCK